MITDTNTSGSTPVTREWVKAAELWAVLWVLRYRAWERPTFPAEQEKRNG